MAAIIMPRGGEPRPHAGGRGAGRRDLREDSRRRRRARWSPATACSTAASRPTPARSSSRSTTSTSATRRSTRRRSRTRARSCDASSRRRRTIEEAIVHSDRAAADPRHRHHRRLRVLDPGHGRRRPGAARRRDAGRSSRRRASGPSSPACDTTFRANTQQLRADVDREKTTLLGIPIQDVYSAIQAQFGSLTVEPVQPVQPRLVGDRAVRRAVPAEPGGPDAPLHAQQPEPDGAAVVGRHDAVDGRARTSCRTSTASPRRRSTATPRRATAPATRSRRWRSREGRAAAGLHVRVVGTRVRGEEVGRHVVDRVRVRPHHRVPGARRAVRVVDAARRGDDGRAVRHPRRAPHQLAARPRQRRLLPDRPAGADRPRRQERRAARVGGRRVPQRRASRSWKRRSSPASSGCGRSS